MINIVNIYSTRFFHNRIVLIFYVILLFISDPKTIAIENYSCTYTKLIKLFAITLCAKKHILPRTTLLKRIRYLSSALILSIVTLPSIWTPCLCTRNTIAPKKVDRNDPLETDSKTFKKYIGFILTRIEIVWRIFAKAVFGLNSFCDVLGITENDFLPGDGFRTTATIHVSTTKNLLGTIIGVGRNTFIYNSHVFRTRFTLQRKLRARFRTLPREGRIPATVQCGHLIQYPIMLSFCSDYIYIYTFLVFLYTILYWSNKYNY